MSDLPPGWHWLKIADLNPEFQNGLSSRGDANGIPTVVLRLADIKDGNISLENTRTLPVSEGSIAKYSAKRSDILVVRVNGSTDIVGKFVSCDVSDVTYCDHFIRMRISSEIMDRRYLALLGSSFIVRRQIEKLFVSTAGQKTINQRHLSSISIPVAPREDQGKIAAAVEEQFSRLDAGVSALTRALGNASRLKSAALTLTSEGVSSWTSLGEISDVVGGVTKTPRSKATQASLRRHTFVSPTCNADTWTSAR